MVRHPNSVSFRPSPFKHYQAQDSVESQYVWQGQQFEVNAPIGYFEPGEGIIGSELLRIHLIIIQQTKLHIS